MLVIRGTPQGRRYHEFRSQFASKNHRGGLTDNPDESEGEKFKFPYSKGCPVKTLERFLKQFPFICRINFEKYFIKAIENFFPVFA